MSRKIHFFITDIKRNKFLCSFFYMFLLLQIFPAGIIYSIYFILISNYLLLPFDTNCKRRWNFTTCNRIKYSKAIRNSAHLLIGGNIVLIILNLPIYSNNIISKFSTWCTIEILSHSRFKETRFTKKEYPGVLTTIFTTQEKQPTLRDWWK